MTTPLQSLPRVLGPWMATAIVVGTVIGSGVFKKGRNVAENVPEFGLGISVWVVCGLLALCGALTLAETAVRYPKAGGNYVFLREAYGRWAGFLWGWVEFGIIRSASIAVLAYMFIESFHDLVKQLLGRDEVLGFWVKQLMTVLVIVVLTIINIRGTRIGGRLQIVLTVLKVGSIIAIAVLPIVIVSFFPTTIPQPTVRNFQPTWPASFGDINWAKYGAAMVAVLWAYHGWMNIGPIAEEVRNPQRNLPLSVLAGVVLLIALYVSANVSYYSVIPRTEMKDLTNTTVATEYCLRLLGSSGSMIASLIVMTSVFGSLNGNILVAPRLLYAMSNDKLAPESMRKLHPRYETPALAMMVYSAWSILLVLVLGTLTVYRLPIFELMGRTWDLNFPENKVPFDVLTDFAIFGSVAFETMAVAAIFVYRYRDPATTAALPYRCPGYPVVPAIYILVMLAVLLNMFTNTEQRAEAFIGLAFISVGGLVYAIFLRPKVTTIS